MMSTWLLKLLAPVLAALALTVSTAFAAPVPSQPIRLVVPYPAGGSSDVMARLIAERMAIKLRMPVIVDNRPGAAAVLGTKSIIKSPPDGHTLLLGSVGAISISPLVNPSVADYDPANDFTAIALVATTPAVLVVPAASPARTLQDLVKLGTTRTDMNYPSSGVGSAGHLAGELLNQASGTRFVHIPYKGAADQLIDLLAGRVQMGFFNPADVAKYVQDGRLRGLVIFSSERSPLLPGVPTSREAGSPPAVPEAWFALMGPARMPPEIVSVLNAACQEALRSPQVTARFETLGLRNATASAEETAAVIKAQTDGYARLIKSSGIKAQ